MDTWRWETFHFSPFPKLQGRKRVHRRRALPQDPGPRFLSPHLHVTLPEVLLTGCSSAPRQQHSRKTDKKVSTPLVAAMVPPGTGGGPSLEGLQLPQPWSPGYLECPGPTLLLGRHITTYNLPLWVCVVGV
uniref:Uncharacterized protein n=1 Tax=Peromyscus maniculatus bairdii TaxID=230844 RepID=A0A8C8UFD6_PERMB